MNIQFLSGWPPCPLHCSLTRTIAPNDTDMSSHSFTTLTLTGPMLSLTEMCRKVQRLTNVISESLKMKARSRHYWPVAAIDRKILFFLNLDVLIQDSVTQRVTFVTHVIFMRHEIFVTPITLVTNVTLVTHVTLVKDISFLKCHTSDTCYISDPCHIWEHSTFVTHATILKHQTFVT